MLEGLFVTPALTAVTEALRSASADTGKLAVVGHAKLATALVDSEFEVVAVGLSARAAKKHPNVVADLSSVDARSLAGVVGVDVATSDAWQATLVEWSRIVRDGGAVVLVDRGHAAEASRRALCAGLTELEQRHVGRLVITSGLVSHF
jgi:hypothetical protein